MKREMQNSRFLPKGSVISFCNLQSFTCYLLGPTSIRPHKRSCGLFSGHHLCCPWMPCSCCRICLDTNIGLEQCVPSPDHTSRAGKARDFPIPMSAGSTPKTYLWPKLVPNCGHLCCRWSQSVSCGLEWLFLHVPLWPEQAHILGQQVNSEWALGPGGTEKAALNQICIFFPLLRVSVTV